MCRAAALRRAYLVLYLFTLSPVGSFEATLNTSLSRKGTLSSSEFAILMRSALSRISPTIHMLMSRYCIFVTSSYLRQR